MRRASTTCVILLAIGIISLALGLPNAWSVSLDELVTNAKKEGTVSWISSFPLPQTQKLSTDFQKKYGIKVEYQRKGGVATAVAFENDQKRKIYKFDMYHSGASEHYPQMYKAGYLTRIDDVPEWQAILPGYRHSHYAALRAVTLGILYNTKLVKPEEVPKTLKELAVDPKWKGRLCTSDPAVAGGALTFYRWAVGHPKLGIEWVRDLKQKQGMTIFGQHGPAYSAIASGRNHLAVEQQDYRHARKPKDPCGWVYPEEGFPVQPVHIAISKNAPHPWAAKLFANWLLSREGQLVVIKFGGADSARADIDMSKFYSFLKNLRLGSQPDWSKLTRADTETLIAKVDKAWGRR